MVCRVQQMVRRTRSLIGFILATFHVKKQKPDSGMRSGMHNTERRCLHLRGWQRKQRFGWYDRKGKSEKHTCFLCLRVKPDAEEDKSKDKGKDEDEDRDRETKMSETVPATIICCRGAFVQTVVVVRIGL